MAKCPNCDSTNVEFYKYLGANCMKCKDCSFDEGDELELYPEDRSSQKAKGGYSPYKTGGGKRSAK